MSPETWSRLEEKFSRHPVLRADLVEEGELRRVEEIFGRTLPSDYREFIGRFGAAIVGSERIYGLRRCDAMGSQEPTVIELTDRYRKHKWPGTENWIVFSEDDAGNPIGFDSSGRVVTFDHDAGEFLEVAASFEVFLMKLLKM